jgi:hypothetical protein
LRGDHRKTWTRKIAKVRMEETWEKDRRKEEEADKREKRKVFFGIQGSVGIGIG